jgi:hypothetical protein
LDLCKQGPPILPMLAIYSVYHHAKGVL